MSATNWKLENGLCRCCLSEGLFKDLGGSFVLNGQLKIYSDTLKDCLDIDLKPMDGEFSMITYTICESCIAKLQDVYNFKNQVLISEERFQEMYSTQIINECEVNVKVEINEDLKDENHTYLDDDDFNYPESDEDNKKLAEIKTSNDALKKGKGKGKTKASPQTKRKATTKNTRSKKKAVDEKAKIDSKEEVDVEIDTELEALDDVDGEEAEGEEPKKKKGKDELPSTVDGQKVVEGSTKYSNMISSYLLKSQAKPSVSSVTNDILSKCPMCDDIINVKKFRYHIKIVHRLVNCRYCSTTLTRRELTKHIWQFHREEMPTCGICGQKNVNPSKIKVHQRRVHMKEKNEQCLLCELWFFDKGGVARHMASHRSEKSYECDYCNKKFPRKSTLRFHIMIHTGEKNKMCSVCGERFVQRASLTYHMGRYHPGTSFD